MSSFRRNVAATYASQIYVTIISLIMVPIYIRYMGTEAYGLVGFYAMLQAWFQMLDLGLSPTLSRQTSRVTGGALDGLTLRRLLRVLEAIFVAIALIGGLSLWLSADWVSTSWLQAQALPPNQIRTAVELISGIIGFRWIAGLYRGAIGGFEKQEWLGWFNSGVATARFVVVLAIFEWIGVSPAHFFGWQLLVAAIETVLLNRKTYALLPKRAAGDPPVGWHWSALRGVMGFSLSIAFTSAVWIAVTQTDKLVLSKLLPLSEYGHFTLAVLAASGVSIVSTPLSMTLLPRLSRLQASGDNSGVIRLYRQATQGMAVIALPVALVLSLGAEQLLLAWTNDPNLATQSAPIVQLYALGNGLLALSAFPYYLQFAKGDVRLHLIGNVLFLLILIPSIIFATLQHGGVGAGWAWLASNFTYMALWVPLVHRRLAPGLHRLWLLSDLFPIAIFTSTGAVLFMHTISWTDHRGGKIAMLFIIGVLTLGIAALASSEARKLIFRNRRPNSSTLNNTI